MPDYHLSFPNTFVGGGYLTYAKVQGRQHLGSIACLVSDGDLVYALASRHVAGAEGRQMFTQVGEKSLLLGTTSRKASNSNLSPKPIEHGQEKTCSFDWMPG